MVALEEESEDQSRQDSSSEEHEQHFITIHLIFVEIFEFGPSDQHQNIKTDDVNQIKWLFVFNQSNCVTIKPELQSDNVKI